MSLQFEHCDWSRKCDSKSSEEVFESNKNKMRQKVLKCKFCGRNYKYHSSWVIHQRWCSKRRKRDRNQLEGDMYSKHGIERRHTESMRSFVNLRLRQFLNRRKLCRMESERFKENIGCDENNLSTSWSIENMNVNEYNSSPELLTHRLVTEHASTQQTRPGDLNVVENNPGLDQTSLDPAWNIEAVNMDSIQMDMMPGVIVIKPETYTEVENDAVCEDAINSTQVDTTLRDASPHTNTRAHVVTQTTDGSPVTNIQPPGIIVVKPEDSELDSGAENESSTVINQRENISGPLQFNSTCTLGNNESTTGAGMNFSRSYSHMSSSQTLGNKRSYYVTCLRNFVNRTAPKIHKKRDCKKRTHSIPDNTQVLEVKIIPQFFSCKFCQMTFPNLRGLKTHHRRVKHPELDRSITQVLSTPNAKKSCKCEWCGLIFPSSGSLSAHIQFRHPERSGRLRKSDMKRKGKNWKCLICGRQFFTMTSFKQHITLRHGTPQRSLVLKNLQVHKKSRQNNLTQHKVKQEPGLIQSEIKVVPKENKVVPSEDNVVSHGIKVDPGEIKVVSSENSMVPDENKVAFSENNMFPDENKVAPGENKMVPDENKVVASENKVVASENKVVPIINQLVLSEDKVATIETNMVPTKYNVVPGENILVPTEYKGVSTKTKMTPSEKFSSENKVITCEREVIPTQQNVILSYDKAVTSKNKEITSENKVIQWATSIIFSANKLAPIGNSKNMLIPNGGNNVEQSGTNSTANDFSCKFCWRSFINKTALSCHITASHSQTSMQNDRQDSVLYSQKIMQTAEQTGEKRGSVPLTTQYLCKECGRYFLNKVGLSIHINKSHSQNSKQIAGQSTDSQKFQQSDETNGYTCILCKRCFVNKTALSCHITAKHSQKSRHSRRLNLAQNNSDGIPNTKLFYV